MTPFLRLIKMTYYSCIRTLLILTIVISVNSRLFSQNELHNEINIKRFAEYLYCKGDYQRAFYEFERMQSFENNDTVHFLSALSLFRLGEYKLSSKYLSSISSTNLHVVQDLNELNLFLNTGEINLEPGKKSDYQLKLEGIKFALSGNLSNSYATAFNPDDFTYYFQQSNNINTGGKSPVLSGILSAIIPGMGQIYSGSTGDGLGGLFNIVTFGSLSYWSFTENKNFTGYLLAAFTAWFYLGNIYGAVQSANNYNYEKLTLSQNSIMDYFKKRDFYLEVNIPVCK
ncbi:MAG: hypothetical protein IAE91_07965 [Ignavibacteriaceae bacterium]|nr:hypothetical protein [Ignavibacteriaceae bacterium]